MKKFLLSVFLLFLFAAALWWVLSQKSGEAIQSTRAEFTVEAGQLYHEFYTDEAEANEKYLNKIIRVNGEVLDFSGAGKEKVVVWLSANDNHAVKCTLDPRKEHRRSVFQKGELVTFKGTCTGLAGQVGLVDCVEE
jgi:putative nucleic acid binding protein